MMLSRKNLHPSFCARYWAGGRAEDFLIANAGALRPHSRPYMKSWKSLAVIPLLVANLWAASPAAGDLPLPESVFPGLDPILKKAVQQSPRMINQTIDLEIAENDRIVARAGLLPNVATSYSYYRSKDRQATLYETPNTPNFINSFTLTKTPYSASVSQPLFYWGERRNTARVGEIRQSMTEGQYRDGYRQLAQALRGEYLRLVIVKLGLTKARFYRDFVNSQLQEAEERFAKKVISEADIIPARISAERAQIALERNETEMEISLRSFARLAGLGASFSEQDIPDAIPVIPSASAGLGRLAADYLKLTELPTLEASTLRRQLQIEELNYKNSRTRLWPKFSLTIGASQDEQQNYFGTGAKYKNSSLYGGITINWQIFDGFAARSAVRSSLARRRQMENDYKQLTEKLTEDAQLQAKQLDFAAREMSISDRYLISAEGIVYTREDEFRRGVRSEAEVSQAKIGLYDAQINAYSARRSYLLAIGDFLGLVVEDPVVANLSNK